MDCLSRAICVHSIPVDIRRPGQGAYVKGRWQTQEIEEFKIKTVVQPMGPEEILRLEDSRHIKEAIKLYTQTRLYPVDIDEKVQPDIVVYHNHEFEVQSVEDWTSFYIVIAVRRERP